MNTIGLGEASQLTGKSKNTIIKAINSGRLSAQKNDHGHYRVEPSELFRVYEAKGETENKKTTPSHEPLNSYSEREQQLLIIQLEQEIERQKNELNEWKERHKQDVTEWKDRHLESENERKETLQRLNNLLTDQSNKSKPKKGLLGRIFG